jgi:putative oxidoreductase
MREIMALDINNTIQILKIIVLTSVIFVWFIRYGNIVEEFKQYKYPGWLRDFVGILKISCVILIQHQSPIIVKTGCLGLAGLMSAAFITHLRVKNPVGKMLPSLTLLIISIIIFLKS